MEFNIARIEPKRYPFGHFLDDLYKLLCYGPESLGHNCCSTHNTIDSSRMNMIVGSHAPATARDFTERLEKVQDEL